MLAHTLMMTPPQADTPSSDLRAADYARVSRAIAYIGAHWQDQPSLDAIAESAGLSPRHLHELFLRWAGLTPKTFLQAITLERAREMLRCSASLLDTALETGLSGTSRLHDLFIQHEAMTPGVYKSGGEGLDIAYGFHDSPFGLALLMATDRGICGLAFADGEPQKQEVLEDMMSRWPRAAYAHKPERTASAARQIFAPELWRAEHPLRVVFIGTDFELRVWEQLLKVPSGRAVTYSDVAAQIGAPRAMRAVGRAVGRNPLSFVVPCHRVLRKDGGLGGYHWGLTRKRAILGWEKGVTHRSD